MLALTLTFLLLKGFPKEFANSYVGGALVRLTNRARPYLNFSNRSSCIDSLRSSGLAFQVIDDENTTDGCLLRNAVQFEAPLDGRHTATCAVALSLHLWGKDTVQPLARKHFGQQVVEIKSLGSRACRTIAGYKYLLSEHAYANAIDISAFVLEDGTRVELETHWDDRTEKGKFLHQVAAQACGLFHLVLTPGYNDAHRDHLHFDMGLARGCKINWGRSPVNRP